jgi:hypothetical protein
LGGLGHSGLRWLSKTQDDCGRHPHWPKSTPDCSGTPARFSRKSGKASVRRRGISSLQFCRVHVYHSRPPRSNLCMFSPPFVFSAPLRWPDRLQLHPTDSPLATATRSPSGIWPRSRVRRGLGRCEAGRCSGLLAAGCYPASEDVRNPVAANDPHAERGREKPQGSHRTNPATHRERQAGDAQGTRIILALTKIRTDPPALSVCLSL